MVSLINLQHKKKKKIKKNRLQNIVCKFYNIVKWRIKQK